MVGTVPPAPQPHAAAVPAPAPAPSSSSAAAVADAAGEMTSSAEEEAFKRNTDCVYFLASPLTCKKVSDSFFFFIVLHFIVHVKFLLNFVFFRVFVL